MRTPVVLLTDPQELPFKPFDQKHNTFHALSSELFRLPVEARMYPRLRERLMGMGVRQGWQLTWFMESLVHDIDKTFPADGIRLIAQSLNALKLKMGDRLIPAKNPELAQRLLTLWGTHRGKLPEFNRLAFPIILAFYRAEK